MGPPGVPGPAGPQGPSGVVGAFTTPLSVAPLTTTQQTVGSGLTFDAPPDGAPMLFAEADGSLMLNAAAGTYAVVELRLVLDGVTVQIVRTEVVNYQAGNLSNAWHLHTMRPVAAGPHEVHVEARVLSATGQVQINSNAGRLSALVLRP